MKVAIDSKSLTSGHSIRGIGFHTQSLIDNLKNISDVDLKVINLSDSKLLKNNKFDIYHYPQFHPYLFTLPLVKLGKTVLTIHDLIPLIYPEHYPSGIKGKLRLLFQKLLIKKIDVIITISETSKKDICRFLGVHPDKVNVVYLAPRKIFRKITESSILNNIEKKYKLPKNFILYVGDVNYNKNLPVLLKACRNMHIPLVICGKQAKNIENQNLNHPELKHLKPIIEDLRNNQKVIKLGFVPDGDLVGIYNLASIYVQPSLSEGFGLPILEAFACGCPVVASKINSLIEIGGNAAEYFSPNNSNSLVEKINLVLDNSEIIKSLIEKGFQKAKEYSWEKCARETYQVYQNLLK